MLRISKSAFFVAGFAIALIAVPAMQAQRPKDAAPIPAQISAAKKVFISNAGQDGIGGFSGPPDRTYNQFYAAMKTWGQYELVSAPADADLVLEISFEVPSAGTSVIKGDSVSFEYAPHFKLLILDPKSHFTLWTFNQYVEEAMRAGNRDKNFDIAMASLVSEVKSLVGPSPSAAASAKN